MNNNTILPSYVDDRVCQLLIKYQVPILVTLPNEKNAVTHVLEAFCLNDNTPNKNGARVEIPPKETVSVYASNVAILYEAAHYICFNTNGKLASFYKRGNLAWTKAEQFRKEINFPKVDAITGMCWDDVKNIIMQEIEPIKITGQDWLRFVASALRSTGILIGVMFIPQIICRIPLDVYFWSQFSPLIGASCFAGTFCAFAFTKAGHVLFRKYLGY